MKWCHDANAIKDAIEGNSAANALVQVLMLGDVPIDISAMSLPKVLTGDEVKLRESSTWFRPASLPVGPATINTIIAPVNDAL